MAWQDEFKRYKESQWQPRAEYGNPSEEHEFRRWLKGNPWYVEVSGKIREGNDKSHEDVMDELLATDDYDYRAAYEAGVRPKFSVRDEEYHWPSSTDDGVELKSPTHPTAWKEFFMRDHGFDPDIIGLGYEEALDYGGESRLPLTGLGMDR